MLHQRATESLRDPAGDLDLHERGVHDATAVVDGHIAQDPDAAAIDVDLDDGQVRAVGERPRLRIREMHRRIQAGLETFQLGAAKVHRAGEVGERQAAVGGTAHAHAPVGEAHVVRMRFEERRGRAADLLAERPRRQQRGAAADRRSAARPRATAVRHERRVA